MFVLLSLISAISHAAGIEWYDPVFEGTDAQGRARILISGETDPGARISIDLSKVIVIRGPQKGKKLSPESAAAVADERGVFDLKTKLPKGLLQVPVFVKGDESQTILVLFDISDTAAKLNVKTKKRSPKPTLKPPAPVVAKADERERDRDRERGERERDKDRSTKSSASPSAVTLRLSVGGNYQKVTQKQEGTNELSFQNIQFPSMAAGLGYEGKNLAGDVSFQSHPGAISQAEPPFTLVKGKANWQILSADLFWRVGDKSSKLGSRVRAGVQSHKIPFLSINQTNQVSLLENSMLGVAFGFGSRFGDPQGWLYDIMVSYIYPVSYDSPELNSFSLLPKLGLELNFGINKRLSDSLSWGGRYTAAMENHGFTYKDAAQTTTFNGELNLFLSVFLLEVGYTF